MRVVRVCFLIVVFVRGAGTEKEMQRIENRPSHSFSTRHIYIREENKMKTMGQIRAAAAAAV